MTSQAVYCLSLQLRSPADDNATDGNPNDPSRTGSSSLLDKMQSDSNELTNQLTSIATTSNQNTIQQTTAHRLTSQPTSNIYLVRGARTENGQIILQNSHDLLSLLNNDDDKPILLQHQRIKTENGPETSSASTILFQPALKATTLSDNPIILQTQAPLKKNVNEATTTGQIFLQQRLNKNGTTDGPILLQTLKRLDKSQPILVFRSAANNNHTTTSTTTTTSLKQNNNNDVGDEHVRKEHNQQSQQKHGNIPLGSDGEPIKLPENLESLPRADHFPVQRHRWNTNEEIAAILISFDKHSEWQSKEVKTRPKSGSMLLYSRKKVRYRRDGYCWKKRKDGKTTREDHMKLKVQGTECIYGCYVHSAILPTFHRRCYWLLQNPDIVLVHYLNVPYPDDNKMAVITPSLSLWGDKKEWTKEELVSQLKPMFFSEDEPDSNNEIEISTAETVEAIVAQLMEKQRLARQAALVKQLECGCPDSTCADGKSCSHPMRRITATKNNNDNKRNETVNQSSNQVTSTTPNVLIGQRIYPRWLERRGGRGGGNNNNNNSSNHQISIIGTDHTNIQDLVHSSLSTTTSTNSITTITTTPKSLDNSIHFQVIPTTSHSNISNQNSNNLIRSNSNNSNTANSQINNNNNNNNQVTNGHNINNNNNNQLIRNNNQLTTVQVSNSNQINLNSASNIGSRDKNINNNNLLQQNDNNNNNNGSNSLIDNNQRNTQNLINTANSRCMTVNTNVSTASIVTSAPPLVLSLSQIQGHGSLLILNGQQQSFVCQPQQHNVHHTQIHHNQQQQQQHHLHQQLQRRNSNTIANNKIDDNNKLLMNNNSNNQSSHLMTPNLVVPKQEAMDSSSSSSDKQLDNVYDSMSYSSTQQNTPIDSPLKENNVKDYHDSLHFFNETLDLSQEDIQKTLSANMPIGNHHQQHHHNAHQQQQQQHQMQLHQHHLNTLNSQQHGGGDQINGNNNINNNHHGQHQHHDGTIGGDINPMDFIDHCDVVGVENVHGNDDDFVNLDAFDMLVEFPELELDGIKNGFLPSTDSIDSHLKKSTDSTVNLHVTNEVFNISDYSPEWAYPEGGVKVLVTGPWNSESSYTVLFDSFPVPTTIVQSGVLRCYCPAHEVGLATLQVACDGYVISNSVMFEYKSPPKSEYTSELNSNEALFKFSLIDRFESIHDRLKIKTEPGETSEEMALFNHSNFEDRMVSLCHTLRTKSWRGQVLTNSWATTHRRMTLLHFASALGYSKLVCAMLTWRNENSNVLLEAEIDALSQDCDGFTPLMWACAKGYTETAVMLYRWNSNALKVKNYFQQSPIEIATKYGYSELIREIEKLEIQQKYKNNNGNNSNNTNSIVINSSNPPPLTSISTNSNPNTIIFTTKSNSILSSNSLTLSNQSIINSNNNSNNNIFTYDNISNNSNFYNINTSNNLSSVFTTVSSALSSLTSSNNTNIKVSSQNINNNNNNNSNNAKENSNKNSSQCLSPASTGSVNSLNSSRSHDGVFLRPGAVSSALSPPGSNNNGNNNTNGSNVRLSKRSSIDSGINIDIRSSTSTLSRQLGGGGNGNLNTSGKCLRDQLKLSRFDRSMSLPITTTSPLSYNNSLDSGDGFSLSIDSSMEGSNNTSSLLNSNCLASPLRKMDFALCEVSGDSSPIGNQQTTSDDDDDEHCCHQEGDNIMIQEGGGVVGESDAKVLTLAEQIIAAMPERIKNESEELMSLGSPITQETLSGDTSVMSGLNDTFMEPLLDSISNSHFDQEFNFEFGDQNYRYHDVGTPCSSLSPASSGPLQSPASYSIPTDPPMGSPSPPPTTQDFTEFLHASNSTLKPFEADFSNLTLTDREQRELYEAAKCIQKAYRSYKGRKKLEEQDKERTAAIVIQNYYRRYKQYAYYRQMTHAALVIQNKFRSYCEHKRFKKSQNQTGLVTENNCSQTSNSNTQFQNFYKNYQHEQQNGGGGCSSGQTTTELSPSGPLKRTYSQRTQNQAARKIQQFMRQSKLKLQKERAEKERLVHQHRAEYLQSLQYQQGRQGVLSRDLSENIHQSIQQQNHHHHSQQPIYHLSSSSTSQIPSNPNNSGQNYWN